MTAPSADPAPPGPAAEPRVPGRRRPVGRRLWWGVAGLAGLVLAGLIIAAIAAARYQPLSVDISEQIPTQAFPGLPLGRGIVAVNTFGQYRQDIYVPPQRGPFTLVVTVTNNGSRPVTIVSADVSAYSPQMAGPARYLTVYPLSNGGERDVWRVLRGYQLRPQYDVQIALPMRLWPCAQTYGWAAVPGFEVTMRFAGFSRTVQLPWGPSGGALIMRQPGGVPGQIDTVCLPGTVLPPPPPGSEPPGNWPDALSGMIVRIYKAGTAGDLRLARLTVPDAAGGFNDPACMTSRPPRQRVADFDLSWGAASGQHAPSPVEHLTVTGPHGEPVTALIPQGPEYTTLTCRDARNLVLPAQPPGAQFFIGLVMRRPKNEWLRTLRVTIDGHTAVIPLTPTCEAAGCFQDSPAIRYQPGTPYSHAFRS